MPKTNEVLETELKNLEKGVGELKDTMNSRFDGLGRRFDEFSSNYVRSELYELRHAELQQQITANAKEIARLKSNKWLDRILTGTAVILIAYLLQVALQK